MFELVSRVANDADDEAALRELGWHDHPAKAMRAAGKEVPAVVALNREAQLEEQIKKLTEELAAARAAPKPAPSEDAKYEPQPRTITTKVA